MDKAKVAPAADKVALERDADVLFFSGEITPDSGQRFLDVVRARKPAKNVVFILVTPGGDPDAAFKVGRALQNTYERVTFFVTGWCKSAGTLVAISAHELVVADCGELGPLDIQLRKTDEIMEMGSGLTVDAALKAMETTALKMFLNLTKGIRRDTAITTKTAADLATRMVTGLLEPIYRQIDPVKIGENSRAMNITRSYGMRLNLIPKNLANAQSMDWLVSLYPDHSFVIDRREAEMLFRRVSEPDPALISLATALGSDGLMYRDQGIPQIEYLSSAKTQAPRRAKKNASASSASKARQRRLPRAGSNGGTSPTAGG